MILKKAKCLNKKNMRYDADWLLDCLMLRLKSKAAYDHLSTSKMIPFPHANTLRRLLSGMSTHFGYNIFALQAMKRILSGLPTNQRVGSLVFDEMSIKEALEFNCQTFNFDGFLDTCCETGSTVLPALHVRLEDHDLLDTEESKLADHALVFVFRPYMASWIQPFAVFASKNATSGEDLYRLVLKALVLLEEHGAIVKSIVCDGAATNKKMWSLAGVYGHTDDHKAVLNNVMMHPSTQEIIYFMGDAPHLIKCIRNHILNTTTVQVVILTF